MDSNFTSINLGKTEIRISLMGIGTWAWGDKFFWDYGRSYDDADLARAFEISVEAGINFFDTAEVYGMGRSERILGKFLADSERELVVATKFFPFPWRLGRKTLYRALRNSLKRLKLSRVHLYQVHWPFPPVSIETWADALAQVVDDGLTLSVGVSNYNEAQMGRAYDVLARRGIPLASNQVVYSLLDRHVERDGLLQACKDLEVSLIAYSPLAQGLLTGKYTPENPPSGVRGRRYNQRLANKAQALNEATKKIGMKYGEKTPAQVALNWVIAKGAVPISGAKNERQARENVGALGWKLDEEDVLALDEMSEGLLRKIE